MHQYTKKNTHSSAYRTTKISRIEGHAVAPKFTQLNVTSALWQSLQRGWSHYAKLLNIAARETSIRWYTAVVRGAALTVEEADRAARY